MNVCTGAVAGFAREQIIEQMVGRSVTEQFPHVPHAAGAPLLEIKDLSGAELPKQVGLTLHRGEILGIAGIVGAGRTELLRGLSLSTLSAPVKSLSAPIGPSFRNRLAHHATESSKASAC